MLDKLLLKTESLTRRFGKLTAVDNVNLEVHEGDIYGFLGLNGAGKTTTIRMILNLIRPTAGRVFYDGVDARSNHKKVMSRIGALVEIPALYPNLSGRDNLWIFGQLAGGVPRSRIDFLLEVFNLKHRGRDKVRTYSQGMRQRLGIAQALLHSPRLVILDEPTNGLDPEGIIETRKYIKQLNEAEGVTFVISSHLLHEIQIVCNRVGIIKQGRMASQGLLKELLTADKNRVKVVAAPADKAEETLKAAGYCSVIKREGEVFEVELQREMAGELNAGLVRAGVAVKELTPVTVGLEEFFEDIMRRN